MKKPNSPKKRVQRFLAKRARNKAKGWDYSDAADPRQQAKVTLPMESIVWALELGLVSNQPTLRDLETLCKQLGSWGRTLVPETISDTTLDTEVRRLSPDYLLAKLVLRVRDLYRSKMLEPAGLPCGVATIDGKNLATLDHDAEGTGHARSSANDKWHRSKEQETKLGTDYYLMPALRSTLTSAEAKLCLYQLALPPGVGESTMLPAIVEAMHQAYGRSGMIEVFDVDAGLTSLANAGLIDGRGYGYIMGLKGNQPELFAEAQALLEPMANAQPPEAETPWERRNGKRIRRRLWRTNEMAGIENSVGTWTHLRQTWLVRQETIDAAGKLENEDRYFISSLLWNYFTPSQILLVVRLHWGVENDAFNSLDLQWREDSGPWCTLGTAVWALGLLRLMAYNTVQLLRRRRLRDKNPNGSLRAPMSWRSLFKVIEDALLLDLEPVLVG
ncbi:MAG: transposase [Burkholderiaceae bacterium]|nr:transposase [Burkholderiaceae bacterium]